MPSLSPDEVRGGLLTGELRRTVFLLALPVLFEQFLSFCVGFYDTWLSGRISSEATSAIGMAAYVGWLASMMFGLVGIGTTALVSRSWGAGDFPQANRVLNVSMGLAGVLGVVVYGVLYSTAPLLATLLNMDAETRDIAVNYLRFDALGHLFGGFTFIGAAALRGAGNMRTPMMILSLVSIGNVIASTLFVFGLGVMEPLGLQGIVLGTVVSRLTGGILMLLVLSRGIGGLHFRWREIRFRDELIKRILRIGVPAAADGGIMWAGHFLFLMIISQLGTGDFESAIFAAHVIGIEVEAITYLPAIAWGHASATLIGQSLGANLPDRARQVGHEAVRQCLVLGVILSLSFFLGARLIYTSMHESSAVHDVGIPAFRLMAVFQVPLVIGIVYVSSLRGAGDTRSPLGITLVGMFLVRLPLAYLFGIILSGGLFGAWIGMCGDMLLRGVLATAVYLRGKWIHVKV